MSRRIKVRGRLCIWVGISHLNNSPSSINYTSGQRYYGYRTNENMIQNQQKENLVKKLLNIVRLMISSRCLERKSNTFHSKVVLVSSPKNLEILEGDPQKSVVLKMWCYLGSSFKQF